MIAAAEHSYAACAAVAAIVLAAGIGPAAAMVAGERLRRRRDR